MTLVEPECNRFTLQQRPYLIYLLGGLPIDHRNGGTDIGEFTTIVLPPGAVRSHGSWFG